MTQLLLSIDLKQYTHLLWATLTQPAHTVSAIDSRIVFLPGFSAPVSPVELDEITHQLGRGSEFGLEKLLQIIGLLPWAAHPSFQVWDNLEFCVRTIGVVINPFVHVDA